LVDRVGEALAARPVLVPDVIPGDLPCKGDVPLFVEHCEAVAAEVDVTRR